MRHGSLFSGIGGFDLASQWMGWENIFHCEWNEFGKKVLKYYWPNAISYDDITKTDFTKHRGTIDILTGGFPCQPYSMAGKRKGKEDERHLWPEMLRAIREIQPTWIVGENVPGLVNWNGGMVFNEVQADLEAEGYEVTPFLPPACGVNAPHKRERVWFVAYSQLHGRNGIESTKRQQYDGGGQTWGKSTSLINCGPTPDTESNRNRGILSGMESENDSERKSEKYRENDLQHRNNGGIGFTPDTTSEQSERMRSEQRELSESEQGESGGNGCSMGEGDVADTNSFNSKTRSFRPILGQSNKQRRTDGYSNVERPDQWQNFPTQSPVCNGDDGLSARLVGITFSKWRNESIKAGGNAIVPQVALQIFKAIEQYNLTIVK